MTVQADEEDLDTDSAAKSLEQTGINKAIANTGTLQLAKIHKNDAFMSPIEERFERITRLAIQSLGSAVAAVTVVHSDTQWFKSVIGWNVSELAVDACMCKQVIEHGKPQIVKDLLKDPRYARHDFVAGHPHFRFYAGLPLFDSDNEVAGTFCALDFVPRQVTQSMCQSLMDLSNLAQNELLTGLLHSAQSALVSKLSVARRQALVDPLTKVWNRRGGDLLMKETLARADRQGESLAIVAVDIDDFKTINDTFGHDVGDRALRMVARELLCCVRDVDGVSRLGGDEFLVVITDISEPELEEIASRLKFKIQSKRIQVGSSKKTGVSVSVGVKWVPPNHNQSPQQLLKSADEELLRDKGRKPQVTVGCTDDT